MPGGIQSGLSGALLLLAIGALTAFWPLRSVLLFTLLAPFANLAEWLGWDPRLAWGMLLGARVVWAWLNGRERRTVLSGGALLAWFLFCVVADRVLDSNAAGLTSEDVAIARSLFFYFVAGSMFLFAAIQFVGTDRQLKLLLRCFAGVALTVSLYACWQAFTTYGSGSVDRIGATLGNPNYLATNLALASTSLLLVARQHRGWLGVYFYFCAGAALLGTVLTLSRAGTMAVFVGWMLVYVTRTGRLEYRKAFLVLAVSASIAAWGAATYLFNYRREITFSADPNRAEVASAYQAAEDFTRLEAALYAVELTGQHPVLGSGFGTFAARNYNANGFYVATHNTWLQLIADTGAVGAMLLSVLVWLLARGLRKAGRILYLPVAGCFLVSSLFGDYLQSIDVIVILAVMYVFSGYATEKNCAPADGSGGR